MFFFARIEIIAIFAKQNAHFGIETHRDVRSQEGDYILSENKRSVMLFSCK